MSSPRAYSVLRTTLRILLFRATRDELLALDRRHLAFGMLCVWLVGMGRYWDDPGAHLLQHLGVGSVLYVVLLAAFLWIVIRPLGPQAWSYERLLTYVALVSPPAALYAIPVERFLTMEQATSVNAWFLAAVASWRVALLVFYLARLARLPTLAVIVGTLLPLTGIVSALAYLNLERAVFEIMASTPSKGTTNDLAYMVLALLTALSFFAIAPLLLAYAWMIVIRLRAQSFAIEKPWGRGSGTPVTPAEPVPELPEERSSSA